MDSDNPWGLPITASPPSPASVPLVMGNGEISSTRVAVVSTGGLMGAVDEDEADDDVVEEEGGWDEMETLNEEEKEIVPESVEREGETRVKGSRILGVDYPIATSTRADEFEAPTASNTSPLSPVTTITNQPLTSPSAIGSPSDLQGEEEEFADFNDPTTIISDDDEFGSFDNSSFSPLSTSFDLPDFSPPLSTHTPIQTRAEPLASTSSIKYTALDVSKVMLDREGLKEGLTPFLERIYGDASGGMSDEIERQVEGVGQVLVNEKL